jgi:hypothetical protein
VKNETAWMDIPCYIFSTDLNNKTMRKVEYKDRSDEVNAVHLALRAVGLDITYEMSDLVKMTVDVVNKKGLEMDLKDTCTVQLKHQRKWDDYFRGKKDAKE